MRRICLGLSLVVIGLGAILPRRPDSFSPDVSLETVGLLLSTAQPVDSKVQPQSRFEWAVRLDPANPFAWADLGDAYSSAGCTAASRAAYTVALNRARSLLAIRLRAAGFYSRCNERDSARLTIRGILASSPEFAYPMFDFYRERHLVDSERLDASLPQTRPIAEAYFQYLLENRSSYSNPSYFEALTAAWIFLSDRWPDSPKLADAYTRFLIAEKQYDVAHRIWRSQLRTPLDETNLISNAGFESPPADWLLDWTVSPWPHVESQRDTSIAHSGSASLRIRFDGLVNTSYSHVAQRVLVRPGHYCLSVWGLAQNLTSDQGVGLRFFDPEDESRLNEFVLQFSGSQHWQRLQECFEIPQETRLAELQIIRSTSNLPNGRIGGTVWIDDITLSPAASGQGSSRAAHR